MEEISSDGGNQLYCVPDGLPKILRGRQMCGGCRAGINNPGPSGNAVDLQSQQDGVRVAVSTCGVVQRREDPCATNSREFCPLFFVGQFAVRAVVCPPDCVGHEGDCRAGLLLPQVVQLITDGWLMLEQPLQSGWRSVCRQGGRTGRRWQLIEASMAFVAGTQSFGGMGRVGICNKTLEPVQQFSSGGNGFGGQKLRAYRC